MAYREHRPPRSHPPRSSIPPDYQQPQSPYSPNPRSNVSFQPLERGDRNQDVPRQPKTAAYHKSPPPSSPPAQPISDDTPFDTRVGRKKSLVRPDREKIEPGHRLWHYAAHAAQLEGQPNSRVGLQPSSTGNYPQRQGLRRGKSLLARDEDVPESGLALFKRGGTQRRRRSQQLDNDKEGSVDEDETSGCFGDIPGPKDPWMIYCLVLTSCIPAFLLKAFGIRTPEQQRAWREKIGLLSIVVSLMAGVGFLTFGFTQTVCGTPPVRFRTGSIGNGSVIIHGYDYDFSRFKHPAAGQTFNGNTNPLLEGNWNIAGADISFMFQNIGRRCKGLITASPNSTIPQANGDLEWYFPCNVYNQFGTSGVNFTGYDSSANCHISKTSRTQLLTDKTIKLQGQVYYTWNDVKNSNRNLAVFESSILDFSLLNWLNKAEVNYPDLFDTWKKPNNTVSGRDITMQLYRSKQKTLGHCLQDIITVGFIDTNTIGCVASQVVLWISLVFIIGVVSIKFAMAVLFGWFLSWKLGAFRNETYEQRMQRARAIENWADDIYRPAPSSYRPNVQKNGALFGMRPKKGFLPGRSRFTPADPQLMGVSPSRPTTTYSGDKRSTTVSMAGYPSKASKLAPPDTPAYRSSRSSTSLPDSASSQRGTFNDTPCPFNLHNVIPQPPPEYQPFNYQLAHTICLVTAYSESEEGLRTTLDSLATTDYPNSHKLILVIADGMVKGAGNKLATPDIVLSMMKELVVKPSEVDPHSYVAIADGHKKHNMAKVYAGFYDYDDATVELSKQQRVPIVLVAKVGNPLEVDDTKPGNRGKRDSQIVLMAFLQKVMFDERMTTFEYEFFNSIWRVTGVCPDRYETVLCVDADTKVFPDSLTRMVACMVHDEEIMGLCGETKIANKAETWVTMIQVFEYYISHHLTKAFESMFGGVTCLPGCFSMYRIKSPKGKEGYWVPILANPDIVQHYSENIVDTLHKKNLLLLGEDRYLTTLMLKTFPKRKMMFCPQAVCKTVVPDTFRILLSQRRRWINSTVHNLAELLLVRDLCGTFCFSMQFVVFMELAGTLVLPAAISFTLYLIVISIIPGGSNTTIPLVLLGIILGLPGLLIVVTSRKVAYVGWMLVYLLSLPIWNFVLPAYAFWHFDDFTWGQTRRVSGDKGGHNGDKEGEFDSSRIVMKRWVEFEKERRSKSGTQSRDSNGYDRSTKRHSLVSSAETYPVSGYDMSPEQTRSRHDNAALLMLPAPLALNRERVGVQSTSSSGFSRTSDEATYIPENSSLQRLVPSPPTGDYSADYFHRDQSPYTPPANYSPDNYRGSIESYVSRSGGSPYTSNPVLRHGTISSPHPGETPNPHRYSQPMTAGYDEESDDTQSSSTVATPAPTPQLPPRNNRGVSLADNGPVPGPEGVRRVARQSARRTSQQQQPPAANRYSRSSMYGPSGSPLPNLPPGAAPPQQPYEQY